MHRAVSLVAFSFLLMFSAAAYAQQAQFGTAEEARAMLQRVAASFKQDPAKTIEQINKGEGGFRDRDLYPSCAGPDGRNVAHADPSRIGLVQKDVKDSTGKPYGEEFAKAQDGKITEVSYMFPRPGSDKTPVQKMSFVTKVADHICV